MLKKSKNNFGFTLIEVLVVIAIIGGLSTIVVSGVSNARKKAETVYIKQTAKEIMTNMELVYDFYGEFGDNLTNTASTGMISSTYFDEGVSGPNFPAGANSCPFPFGKIAPNPEGGLKKTREFSKNNPEYKVAEQIGLGMYKTDARKFVRTLASGEEIASYRFYFWCSVGVNRQSYALAFYGLRDGLNTYCFDSTGKVKQSNTSFGQSPITYPRETTMASAYFIYAPEARCLSDEELAQTYFGRNQ